MLICALKASIDAVPLQAVSGGINLDQSIEVALRQDRERVLPAPENPAVPVRRGSDVWTSFPGVIYVLVKQKMEISIQVLLQRPMTARPSMLGAGRPSREDPRNRTLTLIGGS